MDGYAQGNRGSVLKQQRELLTCWKKKESTSVTAKAAIDLIDNIDNLDACDRFNQLKQLVKLLEETVQRSSEKAALAKVTSDAVSFKSIKVSSDLCV
jgi:tetrahydromethanopterin S-methyltransferase subunit A